ncbi:ATP-binding protein [Acidianus manzaensis]|uniref:ATP-binding protein n=2 Tax=Acidianus manzaensis TaxID=282676 RepID=A0A1W6JYD5_9CREN|nr:ATP-binding protein [Acidianus manzaensis]
MSAKGGVGKSIFSAIFSLVLSEKEDVTLIDMDIHTMASSKLFGFEGKLHEVSKNGIEPFNIGRLNLISLSGVVKNNYVILPGGNQSSVMESLISFSNLKGNVVFDMPPGLGDELLVLEKLANNYSPLVVTTPSKVSIKVVKYLLDYIEKEKGKKNVSLVVNMAYFNCDDKIVKPFGSVNYDELKYEGYSFDKIVEIPIDPKIEDYIGRIQDYSGEIKEKIKNDFLK